MVPGLIVVVVFTLRAAAAVGPTLRDELLDISLSAIETLGFDVHLRTVGGVDIVVPTLADPPPGSYWRKCCPASRIKPPRAESTCW